MFSHFTTIFRRVMPVCLMMFGILSVALAQDEANQVLIPGTSLNVTLGADDLAQVYTFSGVEEQLVSLDVVETSGVPLAVVLTDADGTVLAQAAAAEEAGDLALDDVTLPFADLYYVTVFRAPGAEAGAEVAYQITLSGGTVPGEFQEPGQLLTTTGMQISLTWNSNANMDLEVRDPVGGSLRFAVPQVESGGTFGVNVNSVCNTLTSNAPTEQAAWPAGVIPTGSYEVLVYYQPLENCPTTEPVTFTISAVVDGTLITPLTGTLSPNEIYAGSFVVSTDGTVVTGAGGRDVGTVIPAAVPDLVSAASPITLGVPVTASITNQNQYQTYSFTGNANDVISITMNANSGSLDTKLILIDPNGNLLDANDDFGGFTDAAIVNRTLVLSGQYTLVATRYAQAFGGTEGGYELLLSGPSLDTTGGTAVVPDFPDLPSGAVEISLQWNTIADLQLLVRDPQGNAVFDDIPQIASGGRLAANGNVNCSVANTSPVSYIYWPEGRLPAAGPYEVEVWYQNPCNDTSTVLFTLNIVVNNELLYSTTVQPLPDERFLTNFTINLDGTVAAGEGGVFGTSQRPSAQSLNYEIAIPQARVITSDESITGSLRLNRKYDLYAFDGQAGDLVTIGMQAVSGTLDTTLFLADANGVQIAENDDATRDTTDSLISEFILPEDGRYIIIATHFGAQYGVTSGDYTLTLRVTSP